MNKYTNPKFLLCILMLLICGIVTATHTIDIITPFFLNGKSFETRSSFVQNVLYIVFSLGFSAIYFLIFRFLWNTLHFNQLIQQINQFLSPKIKPWIVRIEKSNWLVRGIFILVLFIGLLVLAVHIKIITFPYQLNLGEGDIQLTTHALLNGINPYALANNPVYINVYGILYNLLILPFAAFFGNTLQLHRLINALSILGQLVLIARVMRLQKIHWLAIFIATIFMWLGQIYLVTPDARPDTFGELLFLLTLFIPLIHKFDTPSLIFSAILGVLSYQTKIYFFLGVIITASYLFFFISKRKALLYTAIAGALFLISIFILNHYFEAYFFDTLFVQSIGIYMNYAKLLEQLMKFIRDYWGLFLIGFGVVLNSASRKWISNFTKIKFDMSHFDNPLLSFSMDLLFYSLILTLFLVIFILNNGTNQIYYYNLITPFLVMEALIYIDRQEINKNWFMFLAILTLITQTYENLKPDFLPFESQDLQKLELRISRAKQVLNSPVDVSILIEQGKPIAMSGLTQSFFYKRPTIPFFLYPDSNKIYEQGLYYLEQIASKIKNKEYDFLETIQNENYEMFHFADRFDPNQSNKDFISDYYHKVDTLTIPMPSTLQEWKIGIWEPN